MASSKSHMKGQGEQELHIGLDFEPGHRFLSSHGTELTAYDMVEKTWRHLIFSTCLLFACLRASSSQLCGRDRNG